MSYLFNGLFAIGLFVGLVLGFGTNEVLSVDATLDPGFSQYVAAILGAVVGGGISLLAQMLANEDERTRRKTERRETQRARTLALMSRVHTALEMVARARSHFRQEDPRGFVFLDGKDRFRKPLSGVHKPISFPEEDQVLPLVLGKSELYNSIREIETATEVLAYLYQEYEKAFNAFMSRAISQGGVLVDGKQISGTFEYKKSDLLVIADLQAHIERLTDSAYPKILDAEKEIAGVLSTHFGTEFHIRVDENVPAGVFSDDPSGS